MSTVKTFYEPECGLLPLDRRFIRITLNETVWVIPARRAITLATAYYEEEGWYEQCELDDDPELHQPHGRELRGAVEANTDLAHHIKESRWSEVEKHAKRISGPKVVPPYNDCCWWFEEQGGEVEEVTDQPLEAQEPIALFWFSSEFEKHHKIFSDTAAATHSMSWTTAT